MTSIFAGGIVMSSGVCLDTCKPNEILAGFFTGICRYPADLIPNLTTLSMLFPAANYFAEGFRWSMQASHPGKRYLL